MKISFDPTDFVQGSEIKTVIDGSGPTNSFVSLLPNKDKTAVDLIVGATFKDRCASAFGKQNLIELAALLVTIASNMEDAHEYSGDFLQEARKEIDL